MKHNVETGGLDDSTDLDAKLTEAHYNRALSYLKLGELELATEAAQAALEINQSYPLALSLLELIKQEYFVIGLTSIKEGEISEGIRSFQSAVNIDPTFTEAYYEIGRACLWLDKLDEAEKVAEKVFDLDSESAHELLSGIKQAYYVRGRTDLSRDRLERAKASIDKALRINSDYKPGHQLLEGIKSAYYIRGLNFLNKNQYDPAITSFESLLSMDAGFAKAHCGIAHVYFAQGKLEAAGESVSEALCLDFNYESARELLKKVKYAYCDGVLNFLSKNQYSTTIYVEPKWQDALVYLEQGELEEVEKVVSGVLGFDSRYKIDLACWFDSDYRFDSDY